MRTRQIKVLVLDYLLSCSGVRARVYMFET